MTKLFLKIIIILILSSSCKYGSEYGTHTNTDQGLVEKKEQNSLFDHISTPIKLSILNAQKYVRKNKQYDVEIAHLLRGMLAQEKDLLTPFTTESKEIIEIKLLFLESQYSRMPNYEDTGKFLSKNATTAILFAEEICANLKLKKITLLSTLLGIIKTDMDKTSKYLISIGIKEEDILAKIKEK